MDWVTQRNTRHVGAEGVESYTLLRVSHGVPFDQGRSGAALGCKTDENVNFLRIYGILGEPGGRGGWSHPSTNQVTAGIRFNERQSESRATRPAQLARCTSGKHCRTRIAARTRCFVPRTERIPRTPARLDPRVTLEPSTGRATGSGPGAAARTGPGWYTR